MIPLIIYHDNCVDEFAAAWVAHKYCKKVSGHEADLYAAKYGTEPPYELAAHRPVYVVDFSYPRAQIERLKAVAQYLFVFDHHKTAEVELRGLDDYCTFDMERSGAGLTWDELFLDKDRPDFIDYIEDRDLWKFELPNSKIINAYIGCIPKTLESYDGLSECRSYDLLPAGLGASQQLNHYAIATALLGRVVDLFERGQAVWCVNCSPVGVSEVCNAALTPDSEGFTAEENKRTGCQIALGWYVANGKLHCSLRSTDRIDVSAIAKHFGGGGHARAAGFAIELGLGDPLLDHIIYGL